MRFKTWLILIFSYVFLNACASTFSRTVSPPKKLIDTHLRKYAAHKPSVKPSQRYNDQTDSASIVIRTNTKRYPSPKLIVTPEVTRELRNFTERNRAFIVKSYSNRESYMEDLLALFDREGMPLELLNVAVIESGFDSQAKSPAGATGMWQFTKGTARSYGLSVNFFVDERKDPAKSTWAAVRHLADLYNEFKDWYLALAAYNAGSGAVRRAIKAGGTRDFWRLARKGLLPRQTYEYVPRFIAVTVIMQNLRDYGFLEVVDSERRATLVG